MGVTIRDLDQFEMYKFVKERLNAFRAENTPVGITSVGKCPYCGVNNGHFRIYENHAVCDVCKVDRPLNDVFDHIMSLITYENLFISHC